MLGNAIACDRSGSLSATAGRRLFELSKRLTNDFELPLDCGAQH